MGGGEVLDIVHNVQICEKSVSELHIKIPHLVGGAENLFPVHAILAARIGDLDKAYELYLRTVRLDLDDYNREVREGCHVTSMAGSWLSVVEGFGGMRVRDGVLSFDPQLPAAWESLSFKVNFRDRVLTVRITRNAVEVANEGAPVELEIRGVRRLIADKVIMNCEL